MRKILLLVLVLVVIGAGIGYRMWHAKPELAASKAADVSVPAAKLYQAFVADETAAGAQYNDKVVQVSGNVREISKEGDRTSVSLETGDPLGAVVCEFSAGEAPELTNSDTVAIKGFCAGYNLDVLLQRCSVVK